MVPKSGRDDAPLGEELYERPSRFQFFQAVRMLRRLYPERASVGRDHDPGDELVRFVSDLSFAFPTGDVRSLERQDVDDLLEEIEGVPAAPEQPDKMTVNFLGLATPNSFGSLPTPYVEEIRFQERENNFAMRDFLDLFNHRLISFFYRAWERSQPAVLYELGEPSGFESALRAIIGIEGVEHQSRVPFESRDILSRAALIAMRPASTTALCGLVESLLGAPASIEQFLPCWYEVDESDLLRLGVGNTSLGEDASLGSEVCLSQWRFRIRIGPMDLATYTSLLPESDAFASLCSVLRLATGPEYDFELTMVLEKQAVPSLRLGGDGADSALDGGRLGWSTWLEGGSREHDADDAVFTPSLALEDAHISLEKTI
jgi:type VI secretion system protein ImpH